MFSEKNAWDDALMI